MDDKNTMAPADMAALADELLSLADVEQSFDRKYNRDVMRRASAALRAAPSANAEPGVGQCVDWRCFHCDEVFTDPALAKDHFGYDMLAEPGCKLSEVEGGLLGIVRRQEERLDAYHREDTASYREFYALGADHYQALRREEERGYARGLRDAASPAPHLEVKA